MELTDLKVLLPLLDRYGMRPKKRFGQHFLCSSKVVETILTGSKDAKGILEIGPGPGVLTSLLSERFEKVLAVEIDPIALSILKETAPKADIIQHDIMKFDITTALESLPKPRIIVSNMPYNLTGPLLFKFTHVKHLFSKAVLMMQKEVGDKILASQGSSEIGAISINLQTFFHIEKICDVPKGAFFPPPKVQSIVLSFTTKESKLSEEESKEFIKFIRGCFSQPRKTLLNNLNTITSQGKELLACLQVVENIRPHQIHLDQWMKLYEEYRSLKRSML